MGYSEWGFPATSGVMGSQHWAVLGRTKGVGYHPSEMDTMPTAATPKFKCFITFLHPSTKGMLPLINLFPSKTQQKKGDLTALLKKNYPWLVLLSGLSAGCKPKGHWFNSQSGHMPGLQARSPVGGAREATTH